MNHLKKHWVSVICICIVVLSYNLYFLFLIPNTPILYLSYLDFLLFCFLSCFLFYEYRKEKKREQQIENLLKSDHVLYQEVQLKEDQAIIEHDMALLQEQLQDLYQTNCDLRDDMANWCHEMKIPLAALMLLKEQICDSLLRLRIEEQLERVMQQLNTALVGCKLQNSLLDIQIKSVDLESCIHAAIHNQQYFLIHEHFAIQKEAIHEIVYTDPQWLIYALDQIIANAIKYHEEDPKLSIWVERTPHGLVLSLKDNGSGICESDLPNIFERGFTGRNHHNGSYKSTGMGLYLVARIMKKLGHEITFESVYGRDTTCKITFQDNRDHFHQSPSSSSASKL